MPSWLDALLPGAADRPAGGYPGERFGLPESGVGSVVGFGRRLAALTVDWLLGYLVAVLFTGSEAIGSPEFPWIVLGVWFAITTLGVGLFGAGPGATLLGIRVAAVDGAAVVGIPRAALRTALVALALPALVRDRDGRGWHDRAARTVVVRAR